MLSCFFPSLLHHGTAFWRDGAACAGAPATRSTVRTLRGSSGGGAGNSGRFSNSSQGALPYRQAAGRRNREPAGAPSAHKCARHRSPHRVAALRMAVPSTHSYRCSLAVTDAASLWKKLYLRAAARGWEPWR